MSGFGRKITAAAVAMSLCAVPTAAIGASPISSAARVATTQTSPWLTLSAMTTSSSAASAAAAAQSDDGGTGFPPVVPLVIILATIALGIYILTKDDDDGDFNFIPGEPVSPS